MLKNKRTSHNMRAARIVVRRVKTTDINTTFLSVFFLLGMNLKSQSMLCYYVYHLLSLIRENKLN